MNDAQRLHKEIHEVIKGFPPETSLLAIKYVIAEILVSYVSDAERPRSLRIFDETLRLTVRKLQDHLDKIIAKGETKQ